MIITSMTELNIYAAYNFSYDFSQFQEAYITKNGFYSNSNPPDPDKIFEYVPRKSLSAVAVLLFAYNLPNGAQIHTAILDQLDNPISGTEVQIGGTVLKSKYIFDSPVLPGTILRFKITPTNLSNVKQYAFCNITITKASQDELTKEKLEDETKRSEEAETLEEVKVETLEEVKVETLEDAKKSDEEVKEDVSKEVKI